MKYGRYIITDGNLFLKISSDNKRDFDTCPSQAYKFKERNSALNFLEKNLKQIGSFYVLDTQDNSAVTQKDAVTKRRPFSKIERKVVYRKSGGRCGICGRMVDEKNFTIDHIVPLSKGGSNDLQNLQAACKFCNEAKGSLTREEFVCKLWEWVFHNQTDFFGVQLNLKAQRIGTK